MPEKEGLEPIRAMPLKFPNIKLISISGGGFIPLENYLAIARGLSATYTPKQPINHADLLAVVEDQSNQVRFKDSIKNCLDLQALIADQDKKI